MCKNCICMSLRIHALNIIIKETAEQDNTNEQLKKTNQFLWVSLMNNYKLSAEEIVYNEIIFS